MDWRLTVATVNNLSYVRSKLTCLRRKYDFFSFWKRAAYVPLHPTDNSDERVDKRTYLRDDRESWFLLLRVAARVCGGTFFLNIWKFSFYPTYALHCLDFQTIFLPSLQEFESNLYPISLKLPSSSGFIAAGNRACRSDGDSESVKSRYWAYQKLHFYFIILG